MELLDNEEVVPEDAELDFRMKIGDNDFVELWHHRTDLDTLLKDGKVKVEGDKGLVESILAIYR
jgi:predicted lipid carrier protein YhbT